jgi:hypothetical protein
MTPPTVQFIPAVGGYQQIVSAPCTSTLNHYATHTNIIGLSIWNGRGLTFSWFFQFVSGTASRVQFYFANDPDRDAAFSAFLNWKMTGTDGLDQAFSAVYKSSASRIMFDINYVFSVGETYTIQGEP